MDNLHWVAASNGEVPPAALKVRFKIRNGIFQIDTKNKDTDPEDGIFNARQKFRQAMSPMEILYLWHVERSAIPT